MFTRDPSAILSFGPLFGQSYLTGEYTFANEALHAGLKLDMWKLVACEFGARSGSDNNAVLLRACAVDGLCEIGDLESYFLSHRFDKFEVEQYQRLKPLVIAAIQSGDCRLCRSGLRVFRRARDKGEVSKVRFGFQPDLADEGRRAKRIEVPRTRRRAKRGVRVGTYICQCQENLQPAAL